MDEKIARKQLKKYLKRGDLVYTQLVHVSKSGMLRKIAVHAVHKNRIVNITGLVAEVTNFKFDSKEFALRVYGVGMDMGFHVVYELGRSLFNKGIDAHGRPESDPGYALKQEWL